MSEELPIAKCDFCMTPNPEPVHVVVSKPVRMADVITTGEWATCGDCMTDLSRQEYALIFQRWMKHAGSAAVAHALVSGQTVVIADWRAHLISLWSEAWRHRTSVREATLGDRMEMVSELEKFRQTHPGRILP